MTISKKEKSHIRFKQVNMICDVVIQKLKNPIHGLVLLLCWRHADERGFFRLSFERIADDAGISRRYAITVMNELEDSKAIRTVSVGGGTIPNRYRLGEPSQVVNCRSLLDQKTGSPPPRKSSDL
jgi:hypothetical protein